MKFNPKSILVVVTIVFLLVGVTIELSRPKEPTYQGRTLHSWLRDLRPDSQNKDAAQIAINQIGTNAIPILLEEMTYQTPNWKRSLALFVRAFADDPYWHYYDGIHGFQALGTNAVPAIPELSKLVHVSYSPDVPEILVRLGEPAIDVVTNGVNDRDIFYRLNFLEALDHAKETQNQTSHYKSEVGLGLLPALNDTNLTNRVAALSRLEYYRPPGEQAVVTIAKLLGSDDQIEVTLALRVLEAYGSEALPALSEVQALCNNKESKSSSEACALAEKIVAGRKSVMRK